MVSLGILLLPLSMQASTLEQQRERYAQAQAALEEQDMDAYNALRRQLDAYPLVPYLDYREFSLLLPTKSVQDVNTFVDEFKALPFSETIHDRYLYQLARTGNWKDFLTMQPDVPRGQALQCYYYTAKLQTGEPAEAWKGAKKAWLTGNSTHDACDPLLDQWKAAGKLTNGLILDRMLLVYGEGNRARLNYLRKQLTGNSQQVGSTIVSLFDKPAGVSAFAKRSKVTPFNQQLTTLAYKKLVRSDVDEAVSQYTATMKGQHFSQVKQQALADYTASRLMATSDADMQAWRDKALTNSQSISLLERRIRQAMREDDWDAVVLWVDRLPEKAKKDVRWRFWQARLDQMAGRDEKAKAGYTALLGQRNFYSAAAATVLGEPIKYPIKNVTDTTVVTKQYQQTLNRIKELVAEDKLLDANREWHYLMRGMDQNEIAALAAYAAKHKWHHLAVQATIAGRLWDHIPLRFPIAHKWWFDFFSKKRDLSTVTMMALARQESAMNVEARSPVGARGLMQLMPATAKATAKKLGRNYAGQDSLFDPGVNIRLGSGYLKMMLERYDNNRIFAFAAYNAGPSRVDRWRAGTDGKLDAYAFIEAIPFNETRGYVQNILMFEVYYGELMGEMPPLLRKNELDTKY
ncbi:murein transglycosylase [Photobacterium aphoticum]|uniref:Lytic transglycosylase n=2 Tax=Photobacterium aphoticum TaxID=754436 RepID=A0A0J1GMR5_9GAMM|nr:lytic transglycosylase [Photobacterium aphoticum]PSU58294.1 murein transglycosylase [Photobacterium aphoticum]GHA50653.1 murein transglycosylase [Photobacterium aphoticum]